MQKISKITCHKTLNSRGDWTIETKVLLSDGSIGVQDVPEGASKGENEAVYIPVEKAIDVVSSVINEALNGEDALNQSKIDQILIDMDGTENKRHLGGNSILSVSLACAKASAGSKKIPLYKYLGDLYGNDIFSIPTPLFNIINGGKHATNNLSFQEFMIIPSKKYNFNEAYEAGVGIYHSLEKILRKKDYETEVGDEGGFAPENITASIAFGLIKEAILFSKFEIGEDIFLGNDAAAGSFRRLGSYCIKEENLNLNTKGLINYYANLLNKFELIYLEDPFYENDFEGWTEFMKLKSNYLLIVGDDLVVTNTKILKKAISKKLLNAVIVKPNQVGTLTETMEFIKLAKNSGLSVIVSHRSGENASDTFISDLSVAVGADFLKAGAPSRGERVAKYNRLYEIFLELNREPF